MKLRSMALPAGPVTAVLIWLLADIPAYPQAHAMLALACWMAIWWITECVPLALTALLPLLAFPLLGIAEGKEVAPKYFNSIIFLFLGGFLIAQAMERSRLHERIALNMLVRLHASPLQLATGFALTTAFLSMWISNTATTMLMVTIALPLLQRLIRQQGEAAVLSVATPLLLIIAYSANLGGIATPVGTAPNLVFLENARVFIPDQVPTFLEWMMLGVPVTLCGLLLLLLLFGPGLSRVSWERSDHSALLASLQELGKVRREEQWVAWVLALTALLWMTRSGLDMGNVVIPGWQSLLPYPGVDDGTVAMFGAALLFLLRGSHGKPVLDSTTFGSLPWDIVMLLGGGFALAYGMQASGLSSWVGEQFAFMHGTPLLLLMLGVALSITFLTEITSNTATTQVMLPVLAAVALTNDMDLLMVLLPATISASCAFMMPVATPPNAIVFGTHMLPMQSMLKAGLRMNLLMALVIVALVWLIRG